MVAPRLRIVEQSSETGLFNRIARGLGAIPQTQFGHRLRRFVRGPVAESNKRLLIHERFNGPANLAAVRLPLGPWAVMSCPGEIMNVTLACAEDRTLRQIKLTQADLAGRLAIDLAFRAFANCVPSPFILTIWARPPPLEIMRPAEFTEAEALRPPIVLACNDAIPGYSVPRLPRDCVSYAIEQAWCDHAGLFISGWIHAFGHPILRLRVATNLAHYDIEHFAARPDVGAILAQFPFAQNSGFALYLPWQAGPRSASRSQRRRVCGEKTY